ncbi:hypothetical protein O6H91_Y091800 [Diphasiastrum complanatum]|nr:hypothetical protein O6H91_Y091800 [Diphasiastrum complanatum]KAJ7300008.1 hypothetical protein O6H91_Y091800 [Diphasiastrum complanatum]
MALREWMDRRGSQELWRHRRGLISQRLCMGSKRRKQKRSSKKEVIQSNLALDSVLDSERKVKVLLRLKDVLASQEAQIMNSQDLGKMRREIGLPHKRKVTAFAKRFPAIFKLTSDRDSVKWLEFAEGIDDLLEEEERIMKEQHEPFLVDVLRKFLMISADKRLPVVKLLHAKRVLGLPADFRTDFIYRYPQFFQVVDGPDGPLLELKEWDSSLAVTIRELKAERQQMEGDATSIADASKSYEFKVVFPKGFSLKKKDRENLERFQELPFPSPYEDASMLDPDSAEAEKRSIAIVHEFLSLTLEKRAIVDFISHFRKEFGLPPRLEAFLERYPGIFFVSHKGDRHTVFLKECYKGHFLMEKSPLLSIKDRFAELQKIRQIPREAKLKSSNGNPENDEQIDDTEEESSDLETAHDDKEIDSKSDGEEEQWSDFETVHDDKSTDSDIDDEEDDNGECEELDNVSPSRAFRGGAGNLD